MSLVQRMKLECHVCSCAADLECAVCGVPLCNNHKVCPECDAADTCTYGDRDEPTLVNVYEPDGQWVFDSTERAVDVANLLLKRGRKASVEPMGGDDIFDITARQLAAQRVENFHRDGYTLKAEYVQIGPKTESTKAKPSKALQNARNGKLSREKAS